MFVYPYKQGSESAKTLAKGLGAKRIKLEGSNFKGGKNKVVINWGSTNSNKEVESSMVINPLEVVANATNKLSFFKTVEGKVKIPPFTLDKGEAFAWLENSAKVVVREKLTGHSGEGIVILETKEDWDNYNHNNAKLYVKYIPKKDEFRIHVVGDKVVLTQRKALRNDWPKDQANFLVRNLANGFIFAKNEGINPPDAVISEALKAIEVTGLDFGAVDVIYNQYKKEAYVLEVNTAPGLGGTTGDTYVEALKQYITMIEQSDGDDMMVKKGKLKLKKKPMYNLDEVAVMFDEVQPAFQENL